MWQARLAIHIDWACLREISLSLSLSLSLSVHLSLSLLLSQFLLIHVYHTSLSMSVSFLTLSVLLFSISLSLSRSPSFSQPFSLSPACPPPPLSLSLSLSLFWSTFPLMCRRWRDSITSVWELWFTGIRDPHYHAQQILVAGISSRQSSIPLCQFFPPFPTQVLSVLGLDGADLVRCESWKVCLSSLKTDTQFSGI